MLMFSTKTKIQTIKHCNYRPKPKQRKKTEKKKLDNNQLYLFDTRAIRIEMWMIMIIVYENRKQNMKNKQTNKQNRHTYTKTFGKTMQDL